MKNNYNNILLAAGLILMVTVARIVNAEMHLYNFVPIAALGLFCGAVVKDRKYAFLFAILAQLAADVYFELFTTTLGFYGVSQIFTYVGLVAVTAFGFLIRQSQEINVNFDIDQTGISKPSQLAQPKPLKILGFTIGASVIFFIISNLGHFAQGWNGYTGAGFVKTYVDAIPFFKNSLIGDMAGSILLFGAYALLQQSVAGKMTKAKA